ncbi:outer membrane protein assembly factor BamB family protein [Halapricum salinum]|uniref:PKD domain-containing protein n=1 Tax=Halapricum salinum TaxID=1457250 RepID=A0A4D6HHK2_9EURY|nr:PQQ-binding-like beta-propeller repeat protein [Halapricum salinum]QCC52716.1 PKD domain-containing protein [Halapricum salinum]
MTRELQSTRRRYLAGLGATAVTAGLGLGAGTASGTVAEAGWTQFGYDTANSGHAPGNRGPKLNIEQRWRFRSSGAGSSAAVTEDTVFAGLDDNVYAIATDDGSERWQARWQQTITSAPSVRGDFVYVGAENNIYGLNRADGDTEWVVSTSGRVTAAPAVTSEMVITGSQDGWIYALDRQNGSERWSRKTDLFDSVSAGAAVADGTVYVGDERGFVYAFAATDGSKQWRYRCQGAIENAVSVVDGTVYASDATGRVYALDASDGSEQWVFDSESAGTSSVAVTDEAVYVGSEDGFLYALDVYDGSESWSYQTAGAVHAPAVANGVVYAGSEDGSVYALEADGGDEQWTFDTGGPVESSPAAYDGTVYVQSSDRGLFAIEQSVEAVISFSPEKPAADERIRFDATGSKPSDLIVSYEWEIDGKTLSGETAGYSFSTKGNRDIRLTVEDKFGNVDTAIRTVPVAGIAPTAGFSVSPSNPNPGDTVIFSAGRSSDPDGEIVEYNWVIGTDSYSGLTVPYTFPETGSYYVELTVIDDDGATDSVSSNVRVEAATTPTPTPPDTTTATPTATPTPTETPTTTPSEAALDGPDSGSAGGSTGGSGDSMDEWLQIGTGGLASLLGLAGWLHFDVTGSDEPTDSATGAPRAADGSGVESTDGSAGETESDESAPSESSTETESMDETGGSAGDAATESDRDSSAETTPTDDESPDESA